MNAVDSLVTQLAAQSSDAWCVVQNSPFRVIESSDILRKQLTVAHPGIDASSQSVTMVLENCIREICLNISVHFQSGDCLPLSHALGPYVRVRLTTVQLSLDRRGFLVFFLEQTAVSPADEIADRISKLSPRQTEIMAGLYAGETNKSMSIRMGISEKTVEKHRAKVMENMQAKTSAELVRMITIAHISGASDNPESGFPKLDQSD